MELSPELFYTAAQILCAEEENFFKSQLCSDNFLSACWDYSPTGDTQEEAQRFLSFFSRAKDPEEKKNLALLCAVAAHLTAVFPMPFPTRANLHPIGAKLSLPISRDPLFPPLSFGVNGCCADFAGSFYSCIGEAAETLSLSPLGRSFVSISTPDSEEKERRNGPLTSIFTQLAGIAPTDSPPHWEEMSFFPAEDMITGAPLLLPTPLVFKETTGGVLPMARSTGCAAQSTLTKATEAALLECVERTALTEWWQGKQPASLLQLSSAEAAYLQRQDLRHPSIGPARQLYFLNLPSPLPSVFVILAITCTPAGKDLCFGSAAACHLLQAALKAHQEVLQLELAALLEAVRARHGALSAEEEQRYTDLKACTLAAVLAQRLSKEDPIPPRFPQKGLTSETMLPFLLQELKENSFSLYRCILTLPQIQIPVVRLLSPQLPSDFQHRLVL